MESLARSTKRLTKGFIRLLGFDLIRYQPNKRSNFSKLLSSHRVDLILDVGANTGQFACQVFCEGFQGKIVSFEPLSSAHESLILASKLNRNWEIAERCALGNADGELAINIAGNSMSSSVLPMLQLHKDSAPTSEYIGSEIAKVVRLDSIAPRYLSNYNRPFLKLDVQGYEHFVLDGARDSLARIAGVQIEMSLAPLYEGQMLFRELFDKMTSLGFDLELLLPAHTDPRNGRLLQVDGVFFPRKS